MEDSDAAFKILSACLGSCRLMYAMRTSRADWVEEVFQEFDGLLKESVESLLGSPLSDSAWRQAQLCTSQGGLGLRSASLHADAAFLASVTGTWELCQAMDPQHAWEGSDGTSGCATAARRYNARVDGSASVDVASAPSEEALVQSKLSGQLDASVFQGLLNNGSVEDKARLHACAAPHAGAWLDAPATKAFGLRLTSAEFATAAMYRLGAPFLLQDTWCSKRDQVLSRQGGHAVQC